jgi:hypothetical protein
MSNIFGTEHTHTTNPLNGGVQYKFEFANGYGAPVVQSSMSYGGSRGLWELAVLKDGSITYDTPLTDDVLGWLSESDVADALNTIDLLSKAGA